MENNSITLSDVERNKELFEYEMTEVILQLKGEFAKVSGKDLHLDNAQFVTKKLNIQSEIPDIYVAQIEFETSQSTNNVFGNIFALPEVQVLHSKIDCPTVPVSASIVLNAVQLEQLKLDCPAVEPVNKIAIGEVKLAVSDVLEPVQKIFLADLPEVNISSVSANQVDTKISIPGEMQKIQLSSKKIEVSDVTVNIPEQTNIQVERFNLEIPQVNKIFVPETNDTLSVSVGKIDIPNTAVSVPETEDISINQIALDIPAISTMTCYKPVKAEILLCSENQVPEFRNLQINVNINKNIPLNSTEGISSPKISEYTPVSLQNILEKISGLTKVPDIILFKEITMTAVNLNEKKSIANEVHIPVIPKETIGEISINVNLPDIEFEYPVACVVNIQPVAIQKTDRIIVPEKVDFSSDIQEILESVV